ncbi:MAG: C40 family peptidase [Propionibacteriales bacterium]|nr:C40 family peptidase [Propionibacteriales bacterium]
MSISDVHKRLGVLNHEGEIASEQLNAVRVEMQAAQQRADTLQADVDHQRAEVEALRTRVVGNAVDSYQRSTSLSSVAAFFVADDAGQFLDDMATTNLVQSQQTGLLIKLSEQQKKLVGQEQQAQDALDALTADKVAAAKHEAELDQKIDDAQELLDGLKQAERQRLARRQAAEAEAAAAEAAVAQAAAAPRPSRSQTRVDVSDATVPDVPASGRAAIAVQTALAQVGDAYVYGAAGPDSFDCSGLTMYAWRAAGVSISHASSAQPGAGTQVSLSSLMPGDLVFYYSPISHVGMYIGNGQLVHAANPSRPVEIVPLYSMPVTMAVRIG